MANPKETGNNERLLLSTKISIPKMPSEFVSRPRLIERIDRGVKGPLTLVAAPAGFGKTNLLVEWAQKTEHPLAWLSIDPDDNDINRFFGYLVGALQTQEPHLGEDTLDIIHSSWGVGLDVGITILLNEIAALPKELVLVCDDFQELEDQEILQNINFILKHIPHNFHIVIASRVEPALDLPFLRAKGWLTELGLNDLRFSSDEVALFFRQAMQLNLTDETITALEKRTDGWVTALQMAAVSLRDQADPEKLVESLQGDAHYMVDFLAEEVLDRQPEEIRQFLLRSSILDSLNGSLCEAVVKPDAQPGYGSAMLNRLEHSHLFISALDDKHEWFRYHHLFVDFLRHIQTEINPMEIPVLQKRAASWFEQNANLDKAFEYALASGDPEWAADLIERNIYSMIRTGEIFTLTHWMGKLPDEIISQRPRLSLPYAWGLIAAYRLDLARYWIEELKRQLDQYEHQIEVEPGTGMSKVDNNFENAGLWNLRGGLALCQSSLALFSGDIEKAAEFTQQAASVLKDENPFIRSLISLDNSLYFILSGDNPKAIESLRDTSRVAKQANNLLVMITSTCQLAHVLVSQGQLNQAWATLQKAQYMATGPDGTPLPLAGMVDTGFGEVLFERNNLDEAYIYLERGHQNSQPMWSFSNMDGMITLARLYQAKGEVEKAKEIMTEASVMALSTEVSKWDDTVISAVSTRLALQRHDLTEAKLWWVRGGYPDLAETIALESYPYHVFEYLQLTQARFLILSGEDTGNSKDIQRALNLLEPLLFEAQRFQRFTSQIEILILKAMAQFALGDERAKDILRQALALGEPEGYRRVFLDEGQRLKELLLQCRAAQRASTSYLPSVAFIQQLLEETPHFDGIAQASPPRVKQRSSPTVIETESGPPIALSMREMEVLRLIAEGKSNQEISAQLFLALNTVKRHAYNIYTKLEVRKRTHAVSKARQLGLIP